jgi:hypothetical protein
MKSKHTKRARVFGWALLSLVALAGQGCVIVEDDTCYEGEVACSSDDFYVVQCIDDTWVVVDDCDSACGGVCGVFEEEIVCFCEL